jgi:DUF4097 and DUF4098 domain-containing protein YvlB
MDRMILFLCLGAVALQGQTNSTITASFSDPDRPGTVKIRQNNGSITVRGYSGKVVLIESKPLHKNHPRMEMRVSEEGNRMTIAAPMNSGITIQVPLQTSLQLNATNGSILVEKVLGELDVQSTNGSIVLRGVAGAVVAHCQNGSIGATFDKVDPRRPMSFSSMNGKIDVTFPADLIATFKVQDERGSVHSDFDILMRGGGPEIQFKNYNGGIYIRKAGK